MGGRHAHVAEDRKRTERKEELKPFTGRLSGQDLAESQVLKKIEFMSQKELANEACTSPFGRVRVHATESIFREEYIREVFEKSPHTDSKELARYKLRGLGCDV